jgi:NAD(P)H-dependent flavin oxidoreductase YrpB (nitropropane dioxygenase family)
MKSPICDMLGIEFPLLAFSHCRDVVAAVSRAGGFGVLGATAHSPETLERELKWIDDHADGKPYGVDVLIPENISTAGEKDITWKSLEARISPAHRDFTRDLLKKYGIELTTTSPVSESTFCCFSWFPVLRLMRLKLTFSLSDEAG